MEVRENEIIKALERMSEEDPDGFSSDILGVIQSQKAEIEILQKAIKVQDIMIEQQDYEIKKAKSEARKEFAERVTDRICENVNRSLDNPNGNNYYPIDVYKDIENLLAEMEERE